MKKWLKHDLSNDFFLALARLNWRMRKFFAILGLIAILGSLLPNIQKAYAYTIPEESTREVSSTPVENATTTDGEFDVSSVALLGEVPSLRTESTKTFQRVDGSYVVAMYADSVHFHKNGKWENIDNSLVLDSSDDTYFNQSNQFKVRFPKSIDENKSVKLEMGNYEISWSILGITKTMISVANQVEKSVNMKVLSGINQEVNYLNVKNGVDIQYIISGTKLKENIVLEHFIEDFSITFEYSTKNLILVQRDGLYSFVNENGDKVFDFSDLLAIDSQGEMLDRINIDISEIKKDTYQVVLSLDNEWAINASFPITIDPSIIIPNASQGIQDTYVYSSSPTNNYSNYSYMKLSGTSSTFLCRSLMQFGLPSQLEGKKLTYAHLSLSKFSIYKTTERELVIYPNTSSFVTNEVSWANKPTYDEKVVDYHIVSSSNTYTFNITNLISEWQDGERDNYGLTIMDKEIYGANNYICSTEYSGTAYDPVVEIGYIDTTGLKDYWTYTSFSAGQAGSAYISDYTGLMTIVRDDLSFDTTKQSFGLSMVYNTINFDSNLGYGAGWQTNYNMKVQKDTDINQYYIEDETGSKEYYHLASYGDLSLDTDVSSYAGAYGSFFICEDGSGSVLILSSTTPGVISGFYVFTADYTLYKFFTTDSNTWYLSEIETGFQQANPLSITIQRSATSMERVLSVTDDSWNFISFQYDLNGYLIRTVLNVLKGVDGYLNPTYHQLEKVEYTYAFNSILSLYTLDSTSYFSDYSSNGFSITADKVVQYGYDASGRMNNAEVSGQNELSWTNNTSGKVDEVSILFNEGVYSTVSYDYSYRKTVITDQDNNWVLKKFDSFGHTVNVSASDGTTTAYEYLNIFKSDQNNEIVQLLDGTPNYKNNHKLVTASEPQQSDLNPLANPGFEYDLYSSYDQWNLYNIYGSLIYGRTTVDAIGTYSLSIMPYSTPGIGYFYQTVILDKGSYTLSAYAKRDVGSNISVYANVVGATMTSPNTYIPDDGEWHFIQQYFTVANDNTNISVRLNSNGYTGTGSGYFDSVQIKEGFITEEYQMLENASFEYTYGSEIPGWSTNGSGISRVTNTYDETIYSDLLGTYGLKIAGDPYDLQSISILRDFFLDEESTGGKVTIGAWAKSQGSPMTGMTTDTYDRVFQIHVYTIEMVTETSGDVVGDYVIRFDPTVDGWQYNFGAIPIGPTIDCMMISVEYQGEGNVWFDGVQITYEPAYNYYEYDAQGRMKKLIHSNGDIIEYEYDTNNDDDRVPIEVYKNGNLEVSIESEWDQFTSITANNVEIVTTTNDSGQTTDVTVAGTTMSSTTYVASAFDQYVDTVTDEFGNETTYHNDIFTSLLEAIENAKGQDTHYIYNDQGQLVYVESKTDYTNQNENALACVIYGYNEFDQLDQIIMGCDANSSYYYEILYDEYGRMDSVTVMTASSSFELINYLYEDGGGFISDNVDTQTYGNLDYLEFDYDDANRISEVRYIDSSATLQKRYGYAYDSLGNLTVYSEYSSTGTVLDRQFYQYDSGGQLVKIIDKDSNEIRFDYGSGGLLALSILIDGNTIESNYNIDLSGILQSSSFSFMDDTVGSISRDYETTGLMRLEGTLLVMSVNQQNTGSVATFFGYDTNSTRVNSVTIDIGQDEDNEYIITYEYDELGNITLIEYLDGQDVIKSFEYTYDSLTRLSTEDIMTIGNSYSNLYRYDSNGNILGVLKYDFNQIPAFDLDSSVFPVNEDHLIASKTYNYSDEWLDQLDSYVTMDSVLHEFTYDNQGNPLTITNFGFRETTYDHADLTWFGRQLTSVSFENEYDQVQASISYSYNDQGYRTKKVITVGSTIETYEYELLGSTVYFEKYTNSTSSLLNYELSYLLDSGNEIIGFVYNGDAYYYIKDIQGNILSVVDNTGVILVQYEYDAYGNLINSPSGTIANINPYTYRGYRWDSEISMFYLNSRFYSPEISRFLNSDGLLGVSGDIQSTNMYAYCQNNPVNNIDPDGYLSLGRNWWNSVVWVSRIINVVILLIPVLLTISKVLKYGGTVKAIISSVIRVSKGDLLIMFGKLATQVGLKMGAPVITTILIGVFNSILELAGTSIGGIFASLLDKIDGKVDGYIYA